MELILFLIISLGVSVFQWYRFFRAIETVEKENVYYEAKPLFMRKFAKSISN